MIFIYQNTPCNACFGRFHDCRICGGAGYILTKDARAARDWLEAWQAKFTCKASDVTPGETKVRTGRSGFWLVEALDLFNQDGETWARLHLPATAKWLLKADRVLPIKPPDELIRSEVVPYVNEAKAVNMVWYDATIDAIKEMPERRHGSEYILGQPARSHVRGGKQYPHLRVVGGANG